MKVGIVLLAMFGSIWPLKAQEEQFTPIKFFKQKRYNSFEEIYNAKTQIQMYSSISDVFLYSRSDSTFITYLNGGYIQEFLIDDMWFLNPSNIKNIEFIDNSGSDDLLVIKTNEFSSKTGSSSNQWFETNTSLKIINLDTHSVIFDCDIDYHFQQTFYRYEEDLSQDSLSEERVGEIIDNREEEIEEVDFTYQVEINGKDLTIKCTQSYSGYEDEDKPKLQEGKYRIIKGRYSKI